MIYVANIDTNKNGQAINVDKLIIVFGTGSSIYQSDLNNDAQQSIYGIYDDLRKTDSDALVKNDNDDFCLLYTSDAADE